MNNPEKLSSAGKDSKWCFTSDRPIYLQIVEELKRRILIGQYMPGERLPSVRDLAVECAVNPNTILRAVSELEALGLVTGQRTAGKSITDDTARIESLRAEIARTYLDDFISHMTALGYTHEQMIAMLERKNNNG
ncbi:MAG: GntR family transcriptional regulator [Clostridiales bacterium]|nr:GntR family transcriptional regulator [Clostridiales bacterium]